MISSKLSSLCLPLNLQMCFSRRWAFNVYGTRKPMGSHSDKTTVRTTRWVMVVFKSGLVPRLTPRVSVWWFHRRQKTWEESATVGITLGSISGDLRSCAPWKQMHGTSSRTWLIWIRSKWETSRDLEHFWLLLQQSELTLEERPCEKCCKYFLLLLETHSGSLWHFFRSIVSTSLRRLRSRNVKSVQKHSNLRCSVFLPQKTERRSVFWVDFYLNEHSLDVSRNSIRVLAETE